MVGIDELVFEGNPNSPPRPFAVAAWLGMSAEEIRAGLANGSIAPPPGAMPGWEPPRIIELFGHEGSEPALATSNGAAGPTNNPSTGSRPPVDDIGMALGRSEVSGWFHALDSSLTDAAFDAIWHRAGDSDSARATNLTAYLSRTLLKATSAQQGGETVAMTTATQQSNAELAAFTADPSHRARVADLAGMDGATLADLARTDVGYRYALAQLDSVALTGNRALFAGANVDSSLDRFDPDTGEVQLSDAWLADRGKFLAWKMAGDAGQSLGIDGAQNWTFIERGKLTEDGRPMTVKLTASAGGVNENKVIFGAESAESIKGGTGTDRIYGGGGDDVLRGADGADRLEGGRGDDFVSGGSGNDELTGNQGDDGLDGGRGADALDGGSGNDTLTGGRGDDTLVGGVGADTYVIDAGDGTDTITDSDGQGTISLDDEMLAGTTLNQDGTWTSSDGRLEYSFVGELAGEGTLTIRAFEAGADHSGTPDNVIDVNNWHNGDLGINLGQVESPDLGSDAYPSDLINPGPQIIADDIPIDAADLPITALDPRALAPQDDAVTSQVGAAVGNEAGATIRQMPAMIPPIFDDAAAATVSEIDDAIRQLLAPPDNGIAALDPALVLNAMAEFSGVLAPPDIPFAGESSGDHVGNYVGMADVTGALADYPGEHDATSEVAAGLVSMTSDWPHVEGVTPPRDSIARITRAMDCR